MSGEQKQRLHRRIEIAGPLVICPIIGLLIGLTNDTRWAFLLRCLTNGALLGLVFAAMAFFSGRHKPGQ
jgi:hypothetical protein